MSQSQGSLVLDEKGTVKDLKTGLMWMVPLVGQGWSNAEAQGEFVKLSWEKATSRYGRARNINLVASDLDCSWAGGDGKTPYYSKYPLSQETYDGYKVGNKPYPFAGFVDWRLPTVDELWSLSQSGLKSIPFTKWADQVWTANPSTKSLTGFISTLVMQGPYAWVFNLREEDSNGWGAMKMDASHPIRLVRAGHIFQALL